MFEDFTTYKNCEPAGLTLPKISVEKEILDELNLNENASSYDVLRGLALKGVKNRGIDKLENKQEYYDRAKYELEVFNKLGFVDYLLLNWEIISFAVSRSITIGQGRGSAPSSLILYLLGVTGIDPIKYGLFFERFVSESRAKKIVDDDGKEFLDGSLAPDVDTDIAHNQRQEVVHFIEERYKGRTSKILTFNTLSSKICIKECAKYFGEVNEDEANVISNLIPKDHGINQSLTKALEDEKFLEWAARNPDILNHALVVENLNKNHGVHPSGIAIASEDIKNLIPLQLSNGGDIISGYDMHDVADLMVKFDILGLRTLSIASLTCKKIGIELDDIDPEDSFVYEQLQDFKYPCGLFQISAHTNSSVCQKVKPLNEEELSDVLALARPSSLQFVDEYVRQKRNTNPLGLDPVLDDILAKSKNVILYQENILQIANLVFGFSLDNSEQLRRSISKKKAEEVGLWKERIYKAAEERGLDVEVADYFWNAVEAAGAYAFNKCLDINGLVKTKDGKKKLKELSIGDEIEAYDVKNKKNHFVEILDILHSEAELYEVELENGKKITCSMEHKFLCDNEKMVPLKDIVCTELKIFSL